MRHDLAQTPIATEDDLERYCQYVGGSIGTILASMFGTSNPEAEHKMAALGRAFQRANICVTSMRITHTAVSTSQTRRSSASGRQPQAHENCFSETRSPAPTGCTKRDLGQSPSSSAVSRRWLSRQFCIGRSCAKSSETATDVGLGARSYQLGEYDYSSETPTRDILATLNWPERG